MSDKECQSVKKMSKSNLPNVKLSNDMLSSFIFPNRHIVDCQLSNYVF
jgi:hypothetical protein